VGIHTAAKARVAFLSSFEKFGNNMAGFIRRLFGVEGCFKVKSKAKKVYGDVLKVI